MGSRLDGIHFPDARERRRQHFVPELGSLLPRRHFELNSHPRFSRPWQNHESVSNDGLDHLGTVQDQIVLSKQSRPRFTRSYSASDADPGERSAHVYERSRHQSSDSRYRSVLPRTSEDLNFPNVHQETAYNGIVPEMGSNAFPRATGAYKQQQEPRSQVVPDAGKKQKENFKDDEGGHNMPQANGNKNIERGEVLPIIVDVRSLSGAPFIRRDFGGASTSRDK